MKRITVSVAATVAGLVIGPTLASALTAMTTEPTNLRAGPAFDFPVVDSIPDDARVTVHGCVRAYRWCTGITGVGHFTGSVPVGAPYGVIVIATEGKMPTVREIDAKAKQTARLIVVKVT